MAWRWSVCGTAEVVWKPRFLWQWPSTHLHFLVSCFSFSSWRYSYILYGVQVWWICWSFNQLLVLLAVCAGAVFCWKMKSASLKSWSAEGSMKCSKFLGKRVQWRWFSKNTMDQHQQMTLQPNHHRLWKLNTGLQATWAMSFSTLPPDSRTLVYKWNTKLALIWKEDFGPLVNSPVLLLLSPGKTPLKTTVAKFLDTSVCGALDNLTPASVHSLWSSPKFLNQFCLTILLSSG